MEAKEILDYLGIEATDLDDFKAKFDTSHMKKDVNLILKDPELKKDIHGRILGSQFTTLKKVLSDFGVDTTSEDFNKLKENNIDAIKFAFNEAISKKEAELEELKGKVGATNDDIIKAKDADLEKLRAKLADTDKAWKQTASELETERQTFAQKFKQKEIDLNKGKLFTDLKLKPKISNLEKIGFEAAIEKSLKFDIDEAGEFIVTDANGSRMPNKAKHGTFLTPIEAVQALADQEGLIEKNPHGGQPAPGAGQRNNPPNTPASHNQNQDGRKPLRVHPNAVKAAGE